MEKLSEKEMDSMAISVPFITSFDLGDLGLLVRVEIDLQSNLKLTSEMKNKPYPIFILDRSGSMGIHCSEIVKKVFPEALTRLGYDENDSINLITFDSNTESSQYTVDKLRKTQLSARGSTVMAGVVDDLLSTFKSLQANLPVIITAISDGEISDQDRTVHAAGQYSSSISSRPGPVSVNLIRLINSSSANPDTRALACLGSFGNTNNGNVAIEAVHTAYTNSMCKNHEEAYQMMVNKIVDAQAPMMKEISYLKSIRPAFRRLPHEPPSKTFPIYNGKVAFVLIDRESALDQITLNGTPIIIPPPSKLVDEESIHGYLKFAESQLRLWSVMGAKEKESDLNSVLLWMQKLKQLIESQITTTSNTSVKIRDRVQKLKHDLITSNKSVLGRIAQLSNRSILSALNSSQQASFLRGDMKSVGTAKRAAKTFGVDDFDEKCRTAIKSLVEFKLNSVPSEEITSYFSCSSASDMISAIEELASSVDDLAMADILTCVGGLGVPVRLRRGDYPDPWRVEVVEVFSGVCLSEADLRYAESKKEVLKCPGRGEDAEINGVVTLRSMNLNDWWDRYQITAISQMQTSVTMRGLVAPVPYDTVALSVGVLWTLIQQSGPFEPVLQVELALIESLKSQLELLQQKLKSFDELANDLKKSDVRAWLTGDRDITSVLKPLMVLTSSPLCTDLRQDPVGMGGVLRVLYEVEVYSTTRRVYKEQPLKRSEDIRRILNIDIDSWKSSFQVGEPFQPDPALSTNYTFNLQQCYDQVINSLSWLPNIASFAAIARFTLPFGGAMLPSMESAFQLSSEDLCLMQLYVVIHGLSCTNEDNCVDKVERVSRGIALSAMTDSTQMVKYLDEVVNELYLREYDQMIQSKRNVEAEIKWKQLINDVMISENYETFINLLKDIPNNTSPAFDELLSLLLNIENAVPERLLKLWILSVGRTYDEKIVFNLGNVYRGKLLPQIESTFLLLKPSGEMLSKLKMWMKLYGIHNYRVLKNRHGHDNNKPSYWAFGYKCLNDFQLAVTDECFGQYALIHNNFCGFHSDTPNQSFNKFVFVLR